MKKAKLKEAHEAGAKGIYFEDWYQSKISKLHAESVIKSIMNLDDIRTGQHQEKVKARFIVMWYLSKYKNKTTTMAARYFGKDHSTCIHGKRQVQALIDTKDKLYFPIIEEFKKEMGIK